MELPQGQGIFPQDVRVIANPVSIPGAGGNFAVAAAADWAYTEESPVLRGEPWRNFWKSIVALSWND